MKKLLAAALFCCVAPGIAAADYSKDIEEHFAKKDTNKDGQISQAEFDQAWKEKFQKADSNNDGQLSKEEYKMLKKDKKDKMGKTDAHSHSPMGQSGMQGGQSGMQGKTPDRS